MVVGLTGGIGSGKTTIANTFGTYPNIVVYIADVEAKKLMNSASVKAKIIDLFGEQSFSNDVVNTKFIAEIVFENQEKLAQLNQIIHPAVYQHFQDFVSKLPKSTIIIYESAILFETNYAEKLDFVISVIAPQELRIQRVMQRDKVDKQAVLNRISKQWNDEKKQLVSHYIIQNIHLDQALQSVKNIHNKLTIKQSLI